MMIVSVSTMKLYNYAFRLFVDFIGTDSVLIGDINSMQMSNFINWLSAKYSGNSGYVVYCIIKSLFNFADKHYYITINPLNMVDTRRHRSRHHHHQALTDRQMVICETVNSGGEHLLPMMDSLGEDELYI